jgi:hypothetical protein
MCKILGGTHFGVIGYSFEKYAVLIKVICFLLTVKYEYGVNVYSAFRLPVIRNQ